MECKIHAQETFHKYECGNLHHLPPAGPLIPALRLFTNHSLQYYLDHHQDLLSSHHPEHGWDYSHLDSDDDRTVSAAYNMQVCTKNIDYQLRYF